MDVFTGFLIFGILINAAYIAFRFYENKNFISLMVLCLQLFSITLALATFFGNVQSSNLTQFVCIIMGIIIPFSVFLSDIKRFLFSYELQLSKVLYFTIIKCIARKDKSQSGYTKLNNLMAENHYKKILIQNPSDSQTLFKLAVSLESLGKYEDAIAAYSTVMRLNEDNIDAFKRYGLLMSKRGNYYKAIDVFKQAILNKPNDYQLYTYLGITLLEIKHFAEAAEAFSEALTIKPDAHEVKCYFAGALIESGNQKGAFDVYKNLFNKNLDDAGIYYNLAQTYSLQCKNDIAIKALSHALELDGHYKNDAISNKAFANLYEKEEFKLLVG